MQSAQFQLHADIEERHWWFVARRQIMRRMIREVLPPSPETTVLDVGCGTGGNIAALAEDYRCIGIDTSSEGIELAARRFPRVRFMCGMAPDGVGGSMSDVRLILLMDVLEHVEDDVGLLSRLTYSANPGTYFLITVPADPGLWSRHDEAFGHYRRYEPHVLAKLWEKLPLTPLFMSHFNSRLYPLVKLARTISRLRGETAGMSGTDFREPRQPLNGIFERIFAGESKRLTNAMHGRRSGYRRGVSLMALLRRD
jgi:SAM-dependent methyltransferase